MHTQTILKNRPQTEACITTVSIKFAKVMAIQETRHRESTRNVNRALLNKLVEFKGNNLSLSDITEEFCRNFAIYLCNKLNTNSARTYLHKLHAILQFSVSCHLLPSNPMPPIKELVPRLKAQQRTYLTSDEVALLEQTPCRHTETKRAFLFACQTGLRLSDIETLRWDDVIDVDGTPTIVKTQVKTGGVVRIPLNVIAQQLVGHSTGNGFIFSLMSRSVIHSDLRKWALDAGIGKRLSFHVSRHTFATLSISAGVDIYVVSKLCGHTSVRTTEIYAHMIDKTLLQGVNKLCNVINSDNRSGNNAEKREKTIGFHGIKWLIYRLFKIKKESLKMA